MFRRFLLASSALALAAGISAGVGTGAAQAGMPPPLQYSGAITCSTAGAISFSPSLVNGGTTSSTLAFKAHLKNCSDPTDSGVTITGGTLLASATLPNNCADVMGGHELPAIDGTVKWKAIGGKVDPSTVSITESSIIYDPDGNTVTADFQAVTSSSGSLDSESGSFSGLTSPKSGYTLDSDCSAPKGLHAFPVGKVAGSVTGSVTLGGAS
jgi:hypothetical protein